MAKINIYLRKDQNYSLMVFVWNEQKEHLLPCLPRSNKHGRKRPFCIIFRPYTMRRITVVFQRVVNDRKRSDTESYDRITTVIGRLRHGKIRS